MTQGPVPPTQKSFPPIKPADLLPPAGNTRLALTLVWRLVLTLVSGADLILMFTPLKTLPRVMSQMLYFTIIFNILVFLVTLSGLLRPLFFLTFLARRKLEGDLGWLRGLSACAPLLTSLVFGSIITGDPSAPTSFIPHLVLLVMAVTDWILVSRNQSLLSWWVPLTQTLSLVPYPLVYVWDTVSDKPMYTFLSPARPSWWPQVAMLSVGFLVLTHALWGAGRLRTRKRSWPDHQRHPGNPGLSGFTPP